MVNPFGTDADHFCLRPLFSHVTVVKVLSLGKANAAKCVIQVVADAQAPVIGELVSLRKYRGFVHKYLPLSDSQAEIKMFLLFSLLLVITYIH